MSTSTGQTCVIIGGGASGQFVATALLKANVSDVVIVQSNPFTEQPVLTPYFMTRPDEFERTAHTKKGAIANLENVAIAGVRYAVGTVTGLSEDGNELLFQDGRKMAFGALVVAVGHHYPAIMAETGQDFTERLQFVKDFPGKVRAAKSIVVGGAGPVALEVASELRRLNSSCKIQMVTSGKNALSSWSGKPAAVLAERLATTNIEVVTGARIVLPEDDKSYKRGSAVYTTANYTLTNGQTLENVDMFLPFFGLSRTGFLPRDMVDGGRGRVKTNDHGQSTERANVFAVGCGSKYPVLVMPVIKKEASVVAANVAALLSGNSVLPETLPEKSPEQFVGYAHLGLGQYTIMNLEQQGCLPGFCGFFCGCLNPVCPCCGCCGWPCSYPGSECQGKCFEKILLSGGNMHPIHESKPPVMAEMAR